jgi:hypothetical protein
MPLMAADPSVQSGGVYKQLTYSEESGDLLGMAVEIRQGSRPTITVTTCEGGCSGGKTWPLTISGQTLKFTVCNDFVDGHGRPMPCERVNYVGHFLPQGRLVMEIPRAPETRTVLKRVLHPKPDEVRKLALVAG